MIFAQLSLIILILAVSLYAFSQLHRLTGLSSEILATDAACIEEEKRLVKIFLAQMRSAEKYLLLRDKVFYAHFTQGSSDFADALEKIAVLIDTPEERELLTQVRSLHARYGEGLDTAAVSRKSTWNKEKTEISDGITTALNELIRLGEERIARKTATTRDKAAVAASVMGWLTIGGISVAILFAYVHARRVSRPLKKLAQELRQVGKGEFRRSLKIRAPKEVAELTQSFNWMSEQLAELDEMKSDFVAHVSHELRTPLTAMQEGTALLLEEIPGPLNESQRQIVEVMRSHSEQLFHTLASVLDLSKMEAHMLEYTPGPSDLALLISNSVETIRLIAQKKQLQLETQCDPSLPLLFLDDKRIQQVLDNLLSNAVKFTPAGGTIQVSATLIPDQENTGNWVKVRVADSGMGVPAEEAEQIFTKFYQSSSHQDQGQRGTGLGLAIARHIVEAHGGKIWVESRPEQGATFVFTLPIHSVEENGGKEETWEQHIGRSDAA
jgi:two-component system sensor histidine kinase GlrK